QILELNKCLPVRAVQSGTETQQIVGVHFVGVQEVRVAFIHNIEGGAGKETVAAAIKDFTMNDIPWRRGEGIIAVQSVVIERELVEGEAHQGFYATTSSQGEASADQGFDSGVDGIVHVYGQTGTGSIGVILRQDFVLDRSVIQRDVPVPRVIRPEVMAATCADFRYLSGHGVQRCNTATGIILQFVIRGSFIEFADVAVEVYSIGE